MCKRVNYFQHGTNSSQVCYTEGGGFLAPSYKKKLSARKTERNVVRLRQRFRWQRTGHAGRHHPTRRTGRGKNPQGDGRPVLAEYTQTSAVLCDTQDEANHTQATGHTRITTKRKPEKSPTGPPNQPPKTTSVSRTPPKKRESHHGHRQGIQQIIGVCRTRSRGVPIRHTETHPRSDHGAQNRRRARGQARDAAIDNSQ